MSNPKYIQGIKRPHKAVTRIAKEATEINHKLYGQLSSVKSQRNVARISTLVFFSISLYLLIR